MHINMQKKIKYEYNSYNVFWGSDGMSKFCPVCKNTINDDTVKCDICNFSELHREFITKEDAQEWFETVVLPYRNEWEELKDTFVDGYNSKGYDRDGYDRMGYDKYGYDKEGYDVYDYDKDGYDSRGYDRQGYDKNGYDFWGFDKNGINKNGDDKYGYEKLLSNNGGISIKTDSGTYYGEVENGKPNGYGEMSYENGDVWAGKWVNGLRHGYGNMTHGVKGSTEGIWENDKGTGFMILKSKDFVYKVTWAAPDSRDVMKFINGITYIGTFCGGKIQKGRRIGKRGALYIGAFDNDLKFCGYGKNRNEYGQIYIGELDNSLANGYGICYFPDGSVLKGHWKDNEYIGE